LELESSPSASGQIQPLGIRSLNDRFWRTAIFQADPHRRLRSSPHIPIIRFDRPERTMANLIWTGILYFSTSMIVYIVYRTFMNDRRAENERRTADAIKRSQSISKMPSLDIAPPRQVVRRPAVVGSPMKVPVASR
jgi:hypothetical protein